MRLDELCTRAAAELETYKSASTFKYESVIDSPQSGSVKVEGRELIMLASNNYLGLSHDPGIEKAARDALDRWGYGLSSVRFLCGTQGIHRTLEERVARFFKTQDATLFTSCWCANEAVFSSIQAADLGMGDLPDIIYSDKLNHASIIDGIRMAKAIRKTTESRPYNHLDIDNLRSLLEADKGKKVRLKFIVTDGVFSMEGDVAPLDKLVDLAKTYGCILVVDESHATGVNGKTGRGTPEQFGVDGQVDIVTGTFGKALGGACGGFVTSRKEVCELLRQKGRPYTFSNSLPPMVCGATLAAFDRLDRDGAALMGRLHGNADRFRAGVKSNGFEVHPSRHAIVPVMIRDTAKTMAFAKELANHGVYAKGLWFPVVERGAERIRVQISAAHTPEQMDRAVAAFAAAGRTTGILK